MAFSSPARCRCFLSRALASIYLVLPIRTRKPPIYRWRWKWQRPGIRPRQILEQMTVPVLLPEQKEPCPIFLCDLERESMAPGPLDHPYKRFLIAKCKEDYLAYNNLVFYQSGTGNATHKHSLKVKCRKANMQYIPYSNWVIREAIKGTHFSSLAPMFEAPLITIAIGSEEPNLLALFSIMSPHAQHILLGGYVDGQMLSRTQLEQYTRLPPVEELRGTTCSLMNGVAAQLVYAFGMPQLTLSSSLDTLSHSASLAEQANDSADPTKTENTGHKSEQNKATLTEN